MTTPAFRLDPGSFFSSIATQRLSIKISDSLQSKFSNKVY
jgi:hypothetical protein